MAWLERHWYSATLVSFLLLPLSLVFRGAVALRRAFYRLRVLSVIRIPVPVIVVGNITVGGTGKTPLVLWLVGFLRTRGMRPGIVSRGYRGNSRGPRAITPASDAATGGDEAVMLAQCCNAPVWVGADRVAAARALLAASPACDIIISDDGLQHYRLARDMEIIVVDGHRGVGNGRMLPAGPLREPATRLASAGAIIVNVSESAAVALKTITPAAYAMSLSGGEFYNLLNPERRADAEYFRSRRVHAVAGIGRPQRFFEHLRRLGVTFIAHPFPDHYRFTVADLAFVNADCIVMTEKDAVKCRGFAHETHWVLPVAAQVDEAFGELVLSTIRKGRHGS